jgi:hypothetical protein
LVFGGVYWGLSAGRAGGSAALCWGHASRHSSSKHKPRMRRGGGTRCNFMGDVLLWPQHHRAPRRTRRTAVRRWRGAAVRGGSASGRAAGRAAGEWTDRRADGRKATGGGGRPGGLRRAGGGRSVGRAAGRPAERASERAGGRAKRAEGRAGERTGGRARGHAGRQEGGRGRDERAGGGRAGRHRRASRQTTRRSVSVRVSSQTRRVGSGRQGTCATAQGGGQHGARADVLLVL